MAVGGCLVLHFIGHVGNHLPKNTVTLLWLLSSYLRCLLVLRELRSVLVPFRGRFTLYFGQ